MKWYYLFLIVFVECRIQRDYFNNVLDRSDQCADQNSIFLIPGVLSSGSNNRGCLSRFGSAARGAARLQVLLPELNTVSPAVELPTGDGGCIDFVIPSAAKLNVKIIVNIRYAESNCTWSRELTGRVLGTKVVLLQTEKPRYRPGETLRLRTLLLRVDFAPPHGTIEEIWLEGPSGIWGEGPRVTQWRNVRTKLGIAQLQYQIDDQAPSGQWVVRAKSSDGSQGSSVFWVGEYQLPPFQLTVRHSPCVLYNSERLVWTVCVRYPWGEAVEGLLVIRLRGAGAGDTSGGVRTVVRARAPRACHRHAIAAARVGLGGPHAPHVIIADFSFQEDGTRLWQNTTVVSRVVEKPLTLEFIAKHRATIVPSLPYRLKVKATRWDEKAAIGIQIKICRFPTNESSDPTLGLEEPSIAKLNESMLTTAKCNNAITDSRGIARIAFTLSEYDSFQYYSFQASLYNDSSISTSIQLPVTRSSNARASFGHIGSDARSRTLIPLYVHLNDVRKPITVHFVVITRGGVIYRWGATTQCPTADIGNYVHTAHKNSECYQNTQSNVISDQMKATNQSEEMLEESVLKVMLPIRITHQMCPDSHLIAYFYGDGQLVSASKHLEVEECFANKADLSWVTRQVEPKSMATLHVSASMPSLCALSALDVTAKTQDAKESLLTDLRKMLAEHRNITAFDCSYCDGESEFSLESSERGTSLALQSLSRAGVRMLGANTKSYDRCVCTSPPAPLLTVSDTPPRSDFAEAWLWRLVAVNGNKSTTVVARAPDAVTRYEATAVCIARNGVAISQPASIQVFREFFIHADMPRRLQRGDTTILRYRIFNYLYENLPVEVEVTSDSKLQVLTESRVTTCVNQRASISRRVEIRAILQGASRVHVRARISNNHRICANYTENNNISKSDAVVIEITVDPEGVPIEEYRSTMLCADGNSNNSPSSVLWTWPTVHKVAGTERWRVWAVGDLAGPLLANADSLVNLPRGCGEQNMARLASNLLALQQLHPDSSTAAVARNHVATGFSRQLQYIHPSGGFSAFGSTDPTASTWLTAFTVRYLRRAHTLLSPQSLVPAAVLRAESWLLSQQMENGCFRNDGQVFHRELKGGLGEDGDVSNVALTAYVVTSLIEGGVTLPSNTLRNSLSCLRALPTYLRVYANALVTYSFMRIKLYEDDVVKRNEAGYLREKVAGLRQDEEIKELVDLLKIAKRSGDFVWWETGNLATSIEATGYAMLALSSCPRDLYLSCAHDARGAMRWLSTHRSSSGGFLSTQDTLVAIEGLLAWSSLQTSPPDLNVTISTISDDQWDRITPSTSHVPKEFDVIPSHDLRVDLTGNGCALVQATRSYNTLSTDNKSANRSLSVQVSVHTDGPFHCNIDNTSCYCAAIVETCAVWSGAFPQMALLEVRLPSGFSADSELLYSQLQVSHTLLRRIETGASENRVTLYLGEREGSESRSGRGGHGCWLIHAVGPQTRTKPAHATILDYYEPNINHTQIYTIPEECPPRVTHESNPDVGTDNIFNSARSLNDESEIIITDEFKFEDIPDGIPLEDPLYDNMRQTDTAYSVLEDKNNDSNDNRETNINQPKEESSDITDTANTSFDAENLNDNYYRNESNMDSEEASNTNQSEKLSVSNVDEDTFENKNVKVSETNNTENTQIEDKSDIMESVSTDKSSVEVTVASSEKHDVIRNSDNNDENERPMSGGQFENFHVINSVTDLEVPAGVEGPVPSYALPPDNFNGDIAGNTEPSPEYYKKSRVQIPFSYPYTYPHVLYESPNVNFNLGRPRHYRTFENY